MPQVRLYQGGQVQGGGTTQARFQTADTGPNPFAVGLETAGKAIGEYVERADQIQDVYDRHDADKLALQHIDLVRSLRQTVKQSRGSDAQGVVAAQTQTLEEKTRELLASARSPRARDYLEREVATRNAEELDSWETHSYSEFVTDRRATLDAKVSSLGEEAADAEDDDKAQGLIAQAADAAEERARFEGHSDPAVIGVVRAQATSKALVNRAYNLNAQDKPEEALAYLDLHRGEINTEDEQSLRIAIKRQLDDMASDSDAAAAMGYANQAPAPQAANDQGDKPEPLPPGESGFLPPIRVRTTTVKGGEYGAPRPYGGHVGRDYAGVPAGTPVYPMAEGTVKKVYRSDKGGNTVEVALAGGYTMRVLHLQDGSTAHLRPGETVGVNDQIGAVGATGTAAHGVHAHVEVTKPNGQRMDPAAAVGRRALPPPPDGRRIDIASAYRYIDEQVANGNWTRARGERAKQQVNQHTSLNDQIRARAEDDARRVLDRQLADMIAKGQEPTGWGKFDPSAVASLDPGTRRQYETMFAENRKPKAPEANGQTALTLTLMSVNEPDRFKQQNLLVYRNQVTPAEFESLATTQAKMRNEKPGASPTANLRGRIDSTIRFYAPDISLDMSKAAKPGTRERENYLRIFNIVQSRIENITGGKREPTDQEMKSAFDTATMEVVQSEVGFFGKHEVKRRAYEAKPGVETHIQVPLPVQTRIINSYRTAYGRMPSETELQNEYLRFRGRPGYWQ